MFERYTDRAKRSVELAQAAAQGLCHDEVGTDHLLLGLLGEGEGVAFRALDSLGVTTEAANEAVCRRHPAGTRRTEGHLPWTSRFRKVQELALRESIELGHNFIATEHLLLGLIRDDGGVGALALADCGTAEADRGFSDVVRAKVLDLLRGYDDAEKRKAAARDPADALTPAERQAVRDAGLLYTAIAEKVVANGPTRDDDLAELRFHVHGIQRMIMAQAAARAFPREFRQLGGILDATDPLAYPADGNSYSRRSP